MRQLGSEILPPPTEALWHILTHHQRSWTVATCKLMNTRKHITVGTL